MFFSSLYLVAIGCSNCYFPIGTIQASDTFSVSESWIYAWMSRCMKQMSKGSVLISVIHFLSFCSLFIFFFSRTSLSRANAELQYSSVRDGNRPPLPDNPNLQDAVTPGNGWTCPQCAEVASRGSSDCATRCDGDGGMGWRGRGMEGC